MCNYCKFEEIKTEAKRAGLQPWVRSRADEVEAMVGGTVVARFAELPDHCVCKEKVPRVVTCVTCEQVLDGGRCTNPMCPGYVEAPCERAWTTGETPARPVCWHHGCDWPDGATDCPEATS